MGSEKGVARTEGLKPPARAIWDNHLFCPIALWSTGKSGLLFLSLHSKPLLGDVRAVVFLRSQQPLGARVGLAADDGLLKPVGPGR